MKNLAEKRKYTIGIDYGTDSVRSLLVNVDTGEELANCVFEYPRWKEGLYCDPLKNQFRQHPLDYIEGLEHVIKGVLSQVSDKIAEGVAGISIDTTGSTPVAVDRQGTPLSLKEEFLHNPNAMFVLWKDHSAISEAMEINALSKKWGLDYTKFEGGVYSPEWFWAKVLHISRVDQKVYEEAWSWVEHCDWIPALLTGNTQPEKIKRSRCAAGHKAMWHESFDGLPSEDFLVALDPLLAGLRDRLYKDTHTCDVAAGLITEAWAERLGLSSGVVIGVGAFDAHLGAVGADIAPYYLTKVMGTSTCDMLVIPEEEMGETLVNGICGQVNGSVLPGLVGLEAGQSAFGDIYAWFRNMLMWPVENILMVSSITDQQTREKLRDEIFEKMISKLSEDAEKVTIEESSVLALDWMNGRRTPDANPNLKGVIAGLTLSTDAPKIFRALVEATAFGSKAIIERFLSEGVRIDGLIALGGVAKKSRFVMQVLSDILNLPIKVVASEQTCALGSAMAASVAAKLHPSFEEALKQMSSGFEKEYFPNPQNAGNYKLIYKKYKSLGRFVENEELTGLPYHPS